MDRKFIQRTSNQAPSAALMLDPIMGGGANFHREEGEGRHAPCSRGRNLTYTSIAGKARGLVSMSCGLRPCIAGHRSKVARPGSQCSVRYWRSNIYIKYGSDYGAVNC